MLGRTTAFLAALASAQIVSIGALPGQAAQNYSLALLIGTSHFISGVIALFSSTVKSMRNNTEYGPSNWWSIVPILGGFIYI